MANIYHLKGNIQQKMFPEFLEINNFISKENSEKCKQHFLKIIGIIQVAYQRT